MLIGRRFVGAGRTSTVASKKTEAALVQVMVIGEGGEAILQIFEDSCILTVRQHELERFAEVRLTEAQAQVLTDAIAQMGTDPFSGGDDDD
jgi:hypothetical protein